MSSLQSLEKSLDGLFEKNAPPLPSNAKKILVEYLPYMNLVLSALTLLAAWDLYDAARAVNAFANVANSLSAAYGGRATVSHLGAMVWISIGVLVIEALLYIAAFPGTKARRKSGWDLLFYAFLVNVVYGAAVLFTAYGGIGRLIGTIISSALGLYLLFQIRDSYKSGRAAKANRSRKSS